MDLARGKYSLILHRAKNPIELCYSSVRRDAQTGESRREKRGKSGQRRKGRRKRGEFGEMSLGKNYWRKVSGFPQRIDSASLIRVGQRAWGGFSPLSMSSAHSRICSRESEPSFPRHLIFLLLGSRRRQEEIEKV